MRTLRRNNGLRGSLDNPPVAGETAQIPMRSPLSRVVDSAALPCNPGPVPPPAEDA